MKMKLTLVMLIATIMAFGTYAVGQGNCSGGGALGCCFCTGSDGECIHDVYGVHEPFDTCSCYTVEIGHSGVYACFGNGACTVESGWGYCGGVSKGGGGTTGNGATDPDAAVFLGAGVKKEGCAEAHDGARKATPEVLAKHPWIASKVLVEYITREQVAPETGELLLGMQQYIHDRGLHYLMKEQRGNAKTGLRGALFTYRGNGTYQMDVFVETPAADGSFKYKNISEMDKGGVAPIETMTFTGHAYTHTVNGFTIHSVF
jgi:hypothetical protein